MYVTNLQISTWVEKDVIIFKKKGTVKIQPKHDILVIYDASTPVQEMLVKD